MELPAYFLKKNSDICHCLMSKFILIVTYDRTFFVGHEHSGDWLWDLMCGMEVPYLWALSQLHFLKKARLHVVCMYTFYLFTESGLFTSRIRNYLVARSKIFSVSQPTNWGTRLLMDGKAWHWDSASWLWGSDPSSSVVFLGFVLCTLPPLSAILDLFLVSVLPPWSVFKYLNSL